MNTLANLPTLPNYRLQEVLGESLQATVYKAALKDSPDRLLRVKLFKQPIKAERQLRYLRQRVERLKVIHDTRVLVPSAFETGLPGPGDRRRRPHGPVDRRSPQAVADRARPPSAPSDQSHRHGPLHLCDPN